MEITVKQRRYNLGCIQDVPDSRDHCYSPDTTLLRQLPPEINLQDFPIYDQGRICSCTANALAGAIEYLRIVSQVRPRFIPSRLFIYYNERTIEGSVDYDAGAELRNGIKTLHNTGVCMEREWGYDDTPPANLNEAFPADSPAVKEPSSCCYEEARKYRISCYQRLNQDLTHFKECLASGKPFVFGFATYDSWLNGKSPATYIPLPTDDDRYVGGHAVLCVGYDDNRKLFRIRNSWGASAGDNGYFYLPYDYLMNPDLARDFWIICGIKH